MDDWNGTDDMGDFNALLNLEDCAPEQHTDHLDLLHGDNALVLSPAGYDSALPGYEFTNEPSNECSILSDAQLLSVPLDQNMAFDPAYEPLQPQRGQTADARLPASLPALDNFSTWLPFYSTPPTPCDYCATSGYECFFTNHDETGCSSCKALLRSCTFRCRRPRSGWLDTLGPVAEDGAQDQMGQVGTRPLFSQGATLNDVLDEYTNSKPERAGMRFPRTTTLVLKRWLEAHADHPYPSEEEKIELKDETGLSIGQISNWLANARRRGKVRPKRTASPIAVSRSPMPSQPVIIPECPPAKQADMDPFERWKNSPPEKEAPLDLIKEAAATISYPSETATSGSRTHSQTGRTIRSSGGSWQWTAASSTDLALPSSRSSTRDSAKSESAYSHGSRQSLTSMTSKGRRRRRIAIKTRRSPSSVTDEQRIYQCTFCTDTFHIKYDWSRHEKSVHLSLDKWICAPLGPVLTCTASGETSCVYCGEKNPTRAHADTHSHYECEGKDVGARTFYRKDHVVQHLRLVHGVPFAAGMEKWKSSPPVLRSRCGFCPAESPTAFTAWQQRVDHLAAHFRAGAKMSQWKGDHGFEPEVAAQITNAMPPYPIDVESRTLDPFSASATVGREARNTHAENTAGSLAITGPRRRMVSNCWEVLTQGLGLFVRRHLQTGVVPTDGMLQREARLMIYEDADEWNQTAADMPEWLQLFKQAHGIGGRGGDAAVAACHGGMGDGCRLGETAHHDPAVDLGGGLVLPDSSDARQTEAGEDLFAFDEDEYFMRLFQQAGIVGGGSSRSSPFSTGEMGWDEYTAPREL